MSKTDPMWVFENYGAAAELIDELDAKIAALESQQAASVGGELDRSAERNAMQRQRDQYEKLLERECSDVDSVLGRLGLTPDDFRTDGGFLKVDSIVAALSPAGGHASVHGGVVMPEELTDDMLSAMKAELDKSPVTWCRYRAAYRAMLAAAKPQARCDCAEGKCQQWFLASDEVGEECRAVYPTHSG